MNVHIKVGHHILSNENPEFEIVEPNFQNAGQMVIGSASETETDNRFISLSDLDAVRNGTSAILFWGYIKYKTMFDEENNKTTKFAVQLALKGDIRDTSRRPFDFVLIGKFYTAD